MSWLGRLDTETLRLRWEFDALLFTTIDEFDSFRASGGAAMEGPDVEVFRVGVGAWVWSWEAETFRVNEEVEGFLVKDGTDALLAREVAVCDV